MMPTGAMANEVKVSLDLGKVERKWSRETGKVKRLIFDSAGQDPRISQVLVAMLVSSYHIF